MPAVYVLAFVFVQFYYVLLVAFLLVYNVYGDTTPCCLFVFYLIQYLFFRPATAREYHTSYLVRALYLRIVLLRTRYIYIVCYVHSISINAYVHYFFFFLPLLNSFVLCTFFFFVFSGVFLRFSGVFGW